MWLFTIYGFFSVSASEAEDGSDVYMIRARRKDHLLRLKKRFSLDHDILTNVATDYRYRIIVSALTWRVLARNLASEIVWPNIKNAVKAQFGADDDYLRAMHRVWSEMYGVQSSENGRGAKR